MASEEQAQAEAPPAEAPVVTEEKKELRRAVVLTGTGGLNKVEVQRIQKHKPKEGHVLIKVHARYYTRAVDFSLRDLVKREIINSLVHLKVKA